MKTWKFGEVKVVTSYKSSMSMLQKASKLKEHFNLDPFSMELGWRDRKEDRAPWGPNLPQLLRGGDGNHFPG